MAREKDYLDAITVVGIFISFGPLLLELIIQLLNANPPRLDALYVNYNISFFFWTGMLMLIYVAYKRIRGKIKTKLFL